MAELSKLTKIEKAYFADDGAKRGPMTMFRVRFHPHEPKLAAQIVDRRLALFDLEAEATKEVKGRGKCVLGELVCPQQIGWVRSLDFHPAGQCIATGGSDRWLRLWPWTDGRPAEVAAHATLAHEGWIDGVAFSPDGKLLVSVGADQLVKVWNASDLSPMATLKGHRRYVTDVVFTRDGQTFITGGEDGQVIFWNATSLKQDRAIDFGAANDQFGQQPRHSGVHRLSVSHDGRWLGVAGGEKLIVYDLASGDAVASEKLGMQVAFHPSANLLAAGESEVKLVSYDPGKFAPAEVDKAGKPKEAKSLPGKQLASVKRGDWSLGLKFSPDGSRLAMGKADGTVELYEVS